MTARIALIRHGPTQWNAEKRLQGRIDIGLDDAGRAAVSAWHLPRDLTDYRVHTSPMKRAIETAAILAGDDRTQVEPMLIEIDFGVWEGARLADLRVSLGVTMTDNEARGLDFRPPDGESPRQVFARLQPLFSAWALTGENHLCVTHKGVIRTTYAHSVGWDMTGQPPDELRWDCAHVFQLSKEGRPSVVRLNVPLRSES